MSSINFDNPWLLLIALPLIALFTVPFLIAVRKDNRNGHNVTSQILHVVMAIIVALAAAGTNITTVISETDVYVLADVSYSASKNLDTIDGYIKNLDLPGNSKLGVVCFGKDQQLVYDLGKPENFTTVKDSGVDDSETNIAEALEYTGTLYGDNVIKRLVLITDGKQTDERDNYAIRRAVNSLQAQNIKVDAIFLDDNIKPGAKEVQISGVTYTEDTYLDHEEEAIATVQASFSVNAFVSLYSGETELKRRPVTLTEGTNSVSFPLDTSAAGTFDYRVEVEAEEDENPANNTYSFTQTVDGNIRMLFLAGSWEEALKAVDRYGETTELDIYENDLSVSYAAKEEAIKNCPINVHIHRENMDVPFTVEALCKFDEIVISGLDITSVTNFTLFAESLDTVVSKFGKSLVTFGNLSIQNKEDKELKQLEDMLPVRYGNNDDAPKLFTLVIDASRSMEQNFHMINAKLAAKALVGLLNEGDNICIVTFDGDIRVAQSPKPVGDGQAIYDVIDGLTNAQGTFIGKGLKTAYDQINPLPYSDKQVMLITDGLSFTDEEDDPVRVATDMYEDGIVTSVLDMARQGENSDGIVNDPTATAAKAMLAEVADVGHGNYYYWPNQMQDKGQIPDILFGQLKGDMTESVIDGRETTVNVVRRVDDVLENIDRTAIPNLYGYLYAYNKASATTVLTVNHQKGGNITEQPLYSYWTYGNGKVSTFTSAFSGAWIRDWDNSADGRTFMDNVLTVNTPAQKTDYPYNLTIERQGNFARIEAVPATMRLSATAVAEITMPNGDIVREQMIFDSDKYYLEFSTVLTGKYRVNVLYDYAETSYPAVSYLNISYTAEYDSFAVYEPSTLHNAIDENGTVSIDGKLKLENDERELGTYTNKLTAPLLIACVVLFVADIVIRKLKWEDVKSFFGFKKNKSGGKK